jgi:succinoglycan biosynthesis transport protein ExoP
VYEAAATLEYDPNPPRPLGSEVEDVASPAGNFLAGKEWYQTQNAIISSRTVARKVVERLELHRDFEFMGIPKDERGAEKKVTVDEAIDHLLKLITVKQERDTRVTRIAVRSSSPDRAASLANAVADAYLDWVMEERLGSTIRAVEWLSGQLDDIAKRLDQSEHALYDFRRENNVLTVSLKDQQNESGQTIHTFNMALAEATRRRIGLAAKLRQLEQAVVDDPMKVHASLLSESRAMSEIRTRYHEAVVQRESLGLRYGPHHPEVRQIEATLDALFAAGREEVTGVINSLRADLREVEDFELGLSRAKQAAQNQGLDLNLHEIDYNRMERERANNEKLHTLLLQRTTETNLTRMLRVLPVRIVDRAAVPAEPVWPRPVLTIALGCLMGILGGVGLGVLRSRMDRSVGMPDDVTALGVTVLGLVPTIQNDKNAGPGRTSRRRNHNQGATVATPRDLVVHTNPRSAVAECCRTNLAFMSTDKPLKALVVTSPGPAEGKSTLTISLAITMANSGRRVLLVDTDMRRPRLHKAFGLASRVGITSVMAGEQTLEQAVQKTVVDNLSLLPCGPLPPNPSELLHTARFRQILDLMRQEFDLVVFDSPPVGVVIDAAIIGPQLDGAILVAESGSTSRDALAMALKQMRDVGTNVLGCVLNDVDLAKNGAYGGYYYYNGSYYYASSDDGSKDGGDEGGDVSGEAASKPAE